MEMVVVAPHGPYLGQPVPVRSRFPAQRLLDGRVHEDPGDASFLSGGADDGRVLRRPSGRIHIEPVVAHHVRGRHLLPLAPRKAAVGHGSEPDIRIQADLVRGMARDHRSAARLRNVADEKTRPSVDARQAGGEPLQEADHLRMTPVAVAGEPHDLPVLAVDRDRRRPGHAASGIAADGSRAQIGRRGAPPEQLLRGEPGIAGISERRQRLRVEGAPVLRGGGATDEKSEREGERANRGHAARLACKLRLRNVPHAAILSLSRRRAGS